LIALTQAAAQQAEAAADALGGMPPHVADRLPGAMLHTMARAAAQEAEWAAQALGAMPLHGAKRLTDADLHARTQAAAQEAEWAAQALGAMPLHGAKRLTDADLHALTQTAAQEAEWAAHACGDMPPHVVERMPDDDVRTLVQAASQTSHAGEAALTLIEFPDVGLPDIVASMAAQEAWSAALALGGMPPQVVARLPDDALHALTRAAAQKDGWAAQALRSLTATLRQGDPTAQAHAARVVSVLIAAAADSLPADDLIAWAQTAPPTALAHGEVLAALLARANADAAAAPLRAILEERLMPPDAPPTPSQPMVRRRGRG
jgi:hypothetical protein